MHGISNTEQTALNWSQDCDLKSELSEFVISSFPQRHSLLQQGGEQGQELLGLFGGASQIFQESRAAPSKLRAVSAESRGPC